MKSGSNALRSTDAGVDLPEPEREGAFAITCLAEEARALPQGGVNCTRVQRVRQQRLRRHTRIARGLAGKAYQTPVLGMEVQGSLGGNASPACSNSMLMLSGERMKAMRPSRGGRLIVTPAFRSRSQIA